MTSSKNWNSWLSITKSHDLTLEIWNYVNSDNLKELALSTDSSRSTVSQIKADAIMFADLEDDELTQYNYLYQN